LPFRSVQWVFCLVWIYIIQNECSKIALGIQYVHKCLVEEQIGCTFQLDHLLASLISTRSQKTTKLKKYLV
jgi:hypothetical protein